MDPVYWIRVVNAVLAGFLVGLCFLKVSWSHVDHPRSARILGLGLLCVAIGWMSLARLGQAYKPWLPVITIGLLFCFYGMRRRAPGEVAQNKRTRK